MSTLFPLATLAYVVGLWLGDAEWVAYVSARRVATAGIVIGYCASRRWRLRIAAILSVMLACGALAMAQRREQAASERIEVSRDSMVEGTICARHGEGASAAFDLCDVSDVGTSAEPLPFKVRVFVADEVAPGGDFSQWQPGARVRAMLRLAPVEPAGNPAARDLRSRSSRQGIGARATLRQPALAVRLSQRDAFSVPGWRAARSGLARWRRQVGETLARLGPGGGLIAALVIGDRSWLDDVDRAAFAKLGIAHLLAVSGLHVALVAGFGFALARRIVLLRSGWVAGGDSRRGALGVAFCGAVVYGAISGFGIPVRRALLFLAVLCVAIAQRRPIHGVQLLCLAALPILILEPQALFDLAAQLSFVASAALLLARRPVQGQPSGLHALVRTSATAIAATAPLLAWNGASAGLLGLVANVLAVPWFAMLVLPTALFATLLASLPHTPMVVSILEGIALLAEYTLRVLVAVARTLPSFQSAGVPHWGIIVLAALVAGAALMLRGTRARIAGCALTGALLALGPSRVVEPRAPRLVAFDVGQGDAVLVQGSEAAILVDAGRAIPGVVDMGRRVVIPGLRALGVGRLDAVVASHADIDHRGGLGAVIEAIPTRVLWLPRTGSTARDFAHLIALAGRLGVPVREIDAESPATRLGDLRVVPLWPVAKLRFKDRNDGSLVLRIEILRDGAPGASVLLPGDIGVDAEAQLLAIQAPLRATVLKVGHHGSRTSTSAAWLDAVRPQIAIVSAACQARTGLPSSTTLARLSDSAAQVWWTGEVGAVMVGFGAHADRSSARGWHAPLACTQHPPRR